MKFLAVFAIGLWKEIRSLWPEVTVWLFSALFAFFALAVAQEDCNDRACPYNYDPICAKPKRGGKAVTFGNDCGLEQYACQTKTSM